MTNNIPGIGLTPGQVNPYTGQPRGNEAPPQNNPTTTEGTPTQTSYVAPNDVLTYMAGTANVHQPRTYDVNKYMTPESVARIRAMMGDFENAVTAGLKAIEDEGLILSDPAKYALAAEMVR